MDTASVQPESALWLLQRGDIDLSAAHLLQARINCDSEQKCALDRILPHACSLIAALNPRPLKNLPTRYSRQEPRSFGGSCYCLQQRGVSLPRGPRMHLAMHLYSSGTVCWGHVRVANV